ncbi:MAG: TlyA family RNA methyltransferase [Acidobacteria bacterium]|nr:TlyA family RNA methyltransferase [Acidobacteriota bacterium]MDW7984246.1 TlyA family RNA methyltransferase [Acidobacteriota bacterium]
MAVKERLDKLLYDRGWVESRARAQSLIIRGFFRVAGRVVTKPGTRVPVDAEIEWVRQPEPYISRGEIKLAHALDVFRVEVTGRVAVDIGASTGGFTHCLLERGARRVYAVDVGRGQLDLRLRQDSRVVVMERTNARYLSRDQIAEPIQLVTIDVSFISVTKVLPALLRLDFRGDAIVLVKPQFELSPRHVGRRGVVRRPGDWAAAVRTVVEAARGLGFSAHGVTPSPIRGAEGNQEFFVHLRYPASPEGLSETAFEATLNAAIGSLTSTGRPSGPPSPTPPVEGGRGCLQL